MASFAEQLKSVKLKSSNKPVKDYSDPKLAGFLSDNDIKTYQNCVLDCNIECWYDIIKDCTFPTKFCQIEVDDAKLFVQIYDRLFKDKDPEYVIKMNWRGELLPDEKSKLDALETKLRGHMTEYIASGYAFVKTSSRSAKDAPLVSEQFSSFYQKYMNELSVESRNSENEQIICLLKAAFDGLRVKSAEQVIEMFIKSERIYQDMSLALDQAHRYRENFVIRKFIDIDIDMEFRGFVYKGKLNALSQYNYLIYSQRLVDNKELISTRIQTYFDQVVAPKLLAAGFLESYIIDFAVFNMTDVLVIELNPFLETTDGALFSWQHERSILEEGSNGLVFRITDRLKPGAKTMLPYNIRKLMNDSTTTTTN